MSDLTAVAIVLEVIELFVKFLLAMSCIYALVSISWSFRRFSVARVAQITAQSSITFHLTRLVEMVASEAAGALSVPQVIQILRDEAAMAGHPEVAQAVVDRLKKSSW